MINYDHFRTQQLQPFSKKYVLQIYFNPQSYLLNNPITPVSSFESPSTKESSKSRGYYIYDEGYDRANLKRLLYQDYEEQVKMKKERDSQETKKQRQLEKKFLRKTEELQAQVQYHELERKLAKQRQLTQDYQQRQEFKKHTKSLEAQQKAKEKNNLQTQKPLDKRAIFEQFYSNCNKQMRLNSKMYLDRVIPLENFREVEKQKLTEAGIVRIAEKYDNLYQNIQHENHKKLNELKSELIHQKLQKEHMRRYNSEQKLHQVNKLNTIQSRYHNPIINPVNLGVNPQNKYVIAEIRKNLEREGSRHEDFISNGLKSPVRRGINSGISSLARNGSQILL